MPLRADLDLHPSAVAAVDGEVRRLGDHHRFGPQPVLVDDVLPAEAVAVFFLDAADHPEREVALEAEFLDDAPAVDDGRERALHVAGAAAVDDAVPLVALERIDRPVGRIADIHGVHVGVEREHARAVADAAEDVAHRVDAHLVVAAGDHLRSMRRMTSPSCELTDLMAIRSRRNRATCVRGRGPVRECVQSWSVVRRQAGRESRKPEAQEASSQERPHGHRPAPSPGFESDRMRQSGTFSHHASAQGR